ncbi:MAG: hypothetical protein A3B23_03690 [Candidatus Colwellbacteria bacterium RIFCSPLOWO2_01_FULL_48_10]|uniref:Uncharacterized protein n=2 Tax=Bacteria candidate phyla TaxID=1783234 RepID=A0A1F5P241_9BACT|nr:MAG: hypothetical protein A2846_04225 [Candidatus Doudnabacteria bacterium RIFCSPHIGHO2_01_FULL_49_9]OGY59292.1 MAG: hypothetical protein A3B23_03690 [Candidatus Colwellbacteria bacterium RIFCSPLOWO2_01_FULL_48_10]
MIFDIAYIDGHQYKQGQSFTERRFSYLLSLVPGGEKITTIIVNKQDGKFRASIEGEPKRSAEAPREADAIADLIRNHFGERSYPHIEIRRLYEEDSESP